MDQRGAVTKEGVQNNPDLVGDLKTLKPFDQINGGDGTDLWH